MSAPAPVEDSPRPVASSSPPHAGMPILRLVRPFAALALFAVLLGRAVGPAVAGVGVGMDRLISTVEYTGKVTTQFFAMLATVLAMAQIITSLRSRLPSAVRLAALGLGGAVILVSLLASPRLEILPVVIVGFMAVAAAVLALLSAGSAFRAPFARPAAMIVGLSASAGLVRLLAVGLAYRAASPGGQSLSLAARGVATAGFMLEVVAVFVATTWIASRSRKLLSVGTLLLLGLAMLLTRQALHAELDDASGLSLLLRRAVERLVTRPEPLSPPALTLFLAFLAPLVAGAALLVRGAPPAKEGPRREGSEPPGAAEMTPVPPAIRGVIALAVLVRGAPEVPINGLLLVIAALSVALTARDDRGVWDAISATTRSRAPKEPQSSG